MDDEIVKWEPNYEGFKEYGRKQFIKHQFTELKKITDKSGFIRQMYMEMMPDIMAKAKQDVSIPLNPYLRIGLELDGKDYHNEEKDRDRDEMLYKFGWKIFRVTGKETYNEFKDFAEIESEFAEYQDEAQQEEYLTNWMFNTCDGVVNAIQMVYFEKDFPNEDIWRLCMQTLERHKLANFQLIDDED